MDEKKNKYYLGVGVLALIITTLAVSGLANANDSQTDQNNFDEKRGQMMQNHEEVVSAIENNDYEAWKTVVGEDSPMLEKINESNWERFVEMHNNLDKAHEIAEELGIDRPFNGQKGQQMMNKGKNFANNEAVKAAFENNDYQAWVTAVGEDFPAVEQITEENFQKMVEAHNLMQAGDKDAAKAIFDELGLKKGFGAQR